MKVVSSRILTMKLGDSKLSIHNLSNSDKYILSVQNIESEDLVILGKIENGYQIGKDGEGGVGQYVILDDVKEEELQKLTEQLEAAFPSQKKN